MGEKNKIKLQLLGKNLLKINIKIAIILMVIYTIFYPYIGKLFNPGTV